jgi:hypothetical protein
MGNKKMTGSSQSADGMQGEHEEVAAFKRSTAGTTMFLTTK